MYVYPEFHDIWNKIKSHTIVDIGRCLTLYDCIKQTQKLPGIMIEVGTYKGGTAMLMSLANPNKEIRTYDTFAGLPNITDKDIHKAGSFKSDYEETGKYLKNQMRTYVYQGVYPECANEQESKVCFIHIDVDVYQSTIETLKYIYDKMVRGGIIVIDDYGMEDCPGVHLAVDEFFADKPEHPIQLPGNQSLIIKE